MTPIDLRDVLSRLFSAPHIMLPELGQVVWGHLLANWWVLLIGTVLFGVVRWWLLRARRPRAIRRTDTRKDERARAKRSMVSALALWSMWIGYIIFALAQVGITLSGVTTGILLGALGVAGALVAQNFLKDLLSGWYVLSEDQYGIGDYVNFGFGFAGTVEMIGLRTTKLRAPDGTIYHIRHSEFPKVGNLTQASGSILLDIELSPADEHFVTPGEVDTWSQTVLDTAIALRRTLNVVREVESGASLDIEDAAAVVPTLVPNMGEETLYNMKAVPDHMEVKRAISKAPAGITPVFHDIEMLGLVGSTTSSVTLRLRVRLREQSSRSYAMQTLRRRLFDVFAPQHIAVNFSNAPADEVIN